jgi:lipopolysaccharide transport system ATP-binding protein
MSFAIRVDNLGKRYRLGLTHANSIRELVNRTWKRLLGRQEKLLPHEKAELQALVGHRVEADGSFWALRDVSFEVQPGEVVGIIGRNGSGKSTLLKILSQITAPTTGRVELHGRVASLLEVGTGFHPELSGRENVYLNGAILGMTKTEIRRKFDEIVTFAEIEQFIDTPVKRYSSGMYVRLAFAVAAHLEPEILVVDEVLAVGDATFQDKCLGKMGDVAKHGRTILFVSHNMAAVSALCDRGIVLKDGQIDAIGHIETAISAYNAGVITTSSGLFDLTTHPGRNATLLPIIKQVAISNGNGEVTTRYSPRDTMIARILIDPPERIREPRVAFAIEDYQRRRLFSVASYFEEQNLADSLGTATVQCTIPNLNLGTGRYYLSVSIGTKYEGLVDGIECFGRIEVEWTSGFPNGESYSTIYGPILKDSHWEVVDATSSNRTVQGDPSLNQGDRQLDVR